MAGCCVEALDIHLEFVHSRLALHVAQHTLLDGGSAGVGAGACAIDVEQRLQGGGGGGRQGGGGGGGGGKGGWGGWRCTGEFSVQMAD